jgi:hypothetical protein
MLMGLSCLQQCGSDTPAEYRELFRLPEPQREARFKEIPIEKQVDAYTYAMYVEPPLTQFASYLASNGQKAVPSILARLEIEKSDTSKADLIDVLKEMHEHHSSLQNEEATIMSLERIISNMTNQYHKKRAEDYLKTIKNSPGFNQ